MQRIFTFYTQFYIPSKQNILNTCFFFLLRKKLINVWNRTGFETSLLVIHVYIIFQYFFFFIPIIGFHTHIMYIHFNFIDNIVKRIYKYQMNYIKMYFKYFKINIYLHINTNILYYYIS